MRIATLAESALDDSPDVKHFELALATITPPKGDDVAETVPEPPLADAPPQLSVTTAEEAPEGDAAPHDGFATVARVAEVALPALGAAVAVGCLVYWFVRARHDAPRSWKGLLPHWLTRRLTGGPHG